MSAQTAKRKHSVEFLFPIVLFLVFALSAISVILFSARVYQREVDNAKLNYYTRTSLEYLTQKIHRSDVEGAISIGSFGDGDAIILSDNASDGSYETYIYCFEGSLMELYLKSGEDVNPAAGTQIIPLKELRAAFVNDHLMRLSCTDTENRTQSTLAAVRSGK